MELLVVYLRGSEDIEVLQLLLLIVAIAALKKPELIADVRNLQIIPTEGGKLVSLTAEEVMLSAWPESKTVGQLAFQPTSIAFQPSHTWCCIS